MRIFSKRTRYLFFTGFFCLLISFLLCGTATIKNNQGLGIKIPGDFSNCSWVKLYSNGNAGFILVCSFENDTQLVFLDSCGNYIDSSSLNRRSLYSFVDGSHLFLTDLPNVDPTSLNCCVKVADYPIGTVASNELYQCALPIKHQLNAFSFAPTQNHWFYWIDFQHPNKLCAFNSHLEQPPTSIFTMHGEYTSLVISPDHYLYATYSRSDKIGIRNLNDGVQKSDLPLYDSCIPAYPYRFLNGNIAMDKNGQIYRLAGSPPTFISSFATQGDCQTACLYHDESVLCKTATRTALEYNSRGEAIHQYNFNGELLSFASNESVCIAAVRKGSELMCINVNDMKPGKVGELPDEPESSCTTTELPNSESTIPVDKPDEDDIKSKNDSKPEPESTSQSEPESSKEEPKSEVLSEPAESIPSEFNSKPESSQESEITKITSRFYSIDSTNKLIYLPDSTSFSKLKKNLLIGNATLQVTKPDGTIETSGNSYIGTGCVLQLLQKDSLKDTLTVIVKGDLTGSGTVTMRSEQKLYQHLSFGTNISNFYLLAADIDGNDTVNTADLLLLRRLRTDT